MKIVSLEEILKPLRDNKKLFQDHFGVTRIGVFGSYTQGRQTEHSDIDIVIEMAGEKKNLHNFLSLKRFLENELNRPVDLGFEHTLKPVVREKIEGKIIYV